MTAMRVLLATDGSEPAQVAQRLAAAIRWPEGSTIRIVTAIDWPLAAYGLPLAPAPVMPGHVDRLDAELVSYGNGVLEEAARLATRSGVEIERRLLRGRPGSNIVDEALEWSADLVIVGSRGHGGLGSLLLGSVSDEVVDHAACPVLVARRETLRHAILGHDGSDFAAAAERVVATWPIFREVPVDVVSVAHVAAPWRTGLAPTVYAEALEAYEASTEAATVEHGQIAEASARRLGEAGVQATPVVVDGDPAEALVRLAGERDADLLVVGTHGRTGVTRALLGSVARNVMQHAPCSVLVVRARRDADEAEVRAVAAAVGAAGPPG